LAKFWKIEFCKVFLGVLHIVLHEILNAEGVSEHLLTFGKILKNRVLQSFSGSFSWSFVHSFAQTFERGKRF